MEQNLPELVTEKATRVPFQEIQNSQDILPTEAVNIVHLTEGNTPQLLIEKGQENEEFKVDGRRVIDFMYFYEELQKISKHDSPFGCDFSHLQLLKEQKKGFNSEFTFVCKMCNIELHVKNCKENESNKDLNLNETAVSSFMSIGAGYAGLEQVSASLGIPCMSKNLYAKCHTKVCELWELAKQKCMEEAAKEEYDLAVKNGDVDANGVPMITVVADACWSKRSYRKNYTALSGAAVIIGYRTKKILYMAVKNKYCIICARAANRNISCPNHVCFKNYSGSSSGMEALAITEGFKNSIEMYGIIYSKLIADGDSCTYKSILDANPYNSIVVEKIECTNHLLRNYCTKLDELAKNTSQPLRLRKVLSQNILRLRRSVTGAVKHNVQTEKTFNEKITDLKEDLLNGPNHVFGNHSACKPYYCKHQNITESNNETSADTNFVPEMKTCTFYNAVMKLVSRLVNNSKSLIYNVNSNIAEVFNSIIAKFVGGKRINFSNRQSYSARCATSVVAFNTKQPLTYLYNKVIHKKPNTFIRRLESKRKEMRPKTKFRRKTNLLKPGNNIMDKDYGYFCQKPDLNEIDFEFSKNEHLKKLNLTEEERNDLERRTVLQSDSMEWMQERRQRLTASSFGKVCKRGLIKCGPLVKNLLRGANLENIKSIQHGKDHENIALEQLTVFLRSIDGSHCDIQKCGLFVDPKIHYLGASPDGLLGDDKIVEIKCPYSCANMSIDDGVNTKKITFWKRNPTGALIINTNHDWYYQVQGQLRITQKSECIFMVWTSVDMKVESIKKDDEFWKNNMENKLKRFYLDCMLPEIIDSRLERKMEVREPIYLMEAVKKREALREAKKRKNENVCETTITKIKKSI